MAFLGLNRALLRADPLRRAISRYEQYLLRDDVAAKVLRDVAPKMIVSTYPIDVLEATMLREAQAAGIPTVVQLLSWDNVTAKGRFAVIPDGFVAWGPIMAREIREHYHVDAERIIQAGVPHFDAHALASNRSLLVDTLQRLALDPNRPFLFFGMSSPIFAPREIDVVEWLSSEVRKGRFGDSMQLVVRPHPQNMTTYMADQSWLARLKRLAGPRVAVDYPILEKSSLAWAMNEGDLPKLASLLGGCSVCINSGSTLSLDAAAHDKPVVMTLFDGEDVLPWWASARRLSEYPHLAQLIKLGGVRVARSYHDLTQMISACLSRPAEDAEGRRRTRDEELGTIDGRASERVATAMVTLLERLSAPRSSSRGQGAVVTANPGFV